jgi:hypothetical protein
MPAWQTGGRTAAEVFGSDGADPGSDFLRAIDVKRDAIEPPEPLWEGYEDVRDAEFDVAQPGWRPLPGSAHARPMSWAQLMAEPPAPPPQLHAGIPPVGLTVLAGPPKVGKTLRASQVALEIRQTALLVIEEGALHGIAFRLRHQAKELGIVDPPIHVMHRCGIRLDNKPSVRYLRDVVADLRPALVVLDPLNRLHGADENRPTQMTQVMDAVSALAYDCACAVVAIHHLAKPSAERRGDVWDRFRGASAIRSASDANLAMEGTGERIKLVGEFRDAEPLSMWLELDRGALLFHEAEPPEAPAKVDSHALRAFVEEQGSVVASEIVARFNVSKVTAIRALRALGCDEFPGSRGTLTFRLPATMP